MIETIKKLIHKYDGLIRYVFVGGCSTLVNMGVFGILCKILHMEVTVSNIISVSAAILFAYVANKTVVFRSHCDSFPELLSECAKFISARISTMIIEVGGVFLLVNILGMEEMLGKLATQILVLIGNYFISKYLVFKKPEKTENN